MKSEAECGACPIDTELQKLKKHFLANFTKKWSNHSHVENKEPCNKLIVLDGNWKCNRLKCAYDNIWKKSEEFGDFKVGCSSTPSRLSYFCDKHKDFELVFEKENIVFKVKPKDIKLSRLSSYF